MNLIYIDPQNQYIPIHHIMKDFGSRFVIALTPAGMLRVHDTSVWVVDGEKMQRLSEIDYDHATADNGTVVLRSGGGAGGNGGAKRV